MKYAIVRNLACIVFHPEALDVHCLVQLLTQNGSNVNGYGKCVYNVQRKAKRKMEEGGRFQSSNPSSSPPLLSQFLGTLYNTLAG